MALLLPLVLPGCGSSSGGDSTAGGGGQAPVNTAPTATGAGLSIYGQRVGGGSRTPWVDDDDIFDTATFQILTQPATGIASQAGSVLSYVPNNTMVASTDSFTYRATDGGGATVDGTMRVVVFDDIFLNQCMRVSTVNLDGTINQRTRSNRCAFYQQVETRAGSAVSPITIDYMRHWPSNTSTPRGIVVLIAGGDLSANIVGDNATGAGTDSSGNFVVRTAQLFANAGFIALTLDRPSDVPGGNNSIVDQYRISVRHAVDIVGLLRHTNVPPLPVFLVGTSRGAISTVANNAIATGIAISSPVTSNGGNNALLYVGRPDVPSLLPASVARPTHVLWHDGDLCSITTPTDSQALVTALGGAGVSVLSDIATGGVQVTSPPASVDVCGALDFHGFLGIEPAAVGLVTAWLNDRVDALGADKLPEAAYVTVSTAAGAAKQIDLGTLTRDADGDPLSYALSHTTTVLGGTLVLNGAMLTYTPPAGVMNQTDHFVYVVTDGKGGVGAAVVSVEIGS